MPHLIDAKSMMLSSDKRAFLADLQIILNISDKQTRQILGKVKKAIFSSGMDAAYVTNMIVCHRGETYAPYLQFNFKNQPGNATHSTFMIQFEDNSWLKIKE